MAVLVEDRRKQVLELVKQRGFITLADLAREVAMSESTVRRDLDHWHARGLIKRIHRGAADRIRNGDAILLDGGTTTLEVAKLLVGRPVQIVTNSLPIANLFANSQETDLVMLGGYVYPTTGVALGPLTIQVMQNVQVQ